MGDISIRYNSRADRKKLISHVLHYPDGIDRVLTMQSYKWEWVRLAEQDACPFNEVLGAAITLAHEFPSAHGYQYDVLYQTELMLRVIAETIYEETAPPANSGNPFVERD